MASLWPPLPITHTGMDSPGWGALATTQCATPALLSANQRPLIQSPFIQSLLIKGPQRPPGATSPQLLEHLEEVDKGTGVAFEAGQRGAGEKYSLDIRRPA